MSDFEISADRLDDAPHPRERAVLVGQAAAERALLEAYLGQRMHHAWILGGPRGIGKATLAYRFARFVLANPDPRVFEGRRPPSDLSVASDAPAFAKVAAGSHPNLLAIRRVQEPGKTTMPTVITVDTVRRIVPFFSSTAAEGGWRVAIVDAADEMNIASANALLKMLEEPPRQSLFLLVAHLPGRLLPTIRSRCRMLRMAPLTQAEVAAGLASFDDFDPSADEIDAAAAASEGSLRRAIEYARGGHGELVAAVDSVLARLPDIDMAAVHALGDRLARRDDAALDAFVERVRDHLGQAARERAGQGARRLAPFSEVWEKTERALGEVRTFNLERKPFVFQVFGWLSDASRRAA